VPNVSLYNAYLALRAAGEPHGLSLFGARAVDSMRMEKGFLHWKADLLTEFDPFETGLDRFVKLSKPDFVGKSALEARANAGPSKRLVALEIASTTLPAHGGGSLIARGKIVGTITSGDWGHRTGKNLAYAFVDPDLADEGQVMQLNLCGELVKATVTRMCQYDPDGERMRG